MTTVEPLQAPPARCSTPGCSHALEASIATPPTSLLATAVAPTPTLAPVVLGAEAEVSATLPTKCSIQGHNDFNNMFNTSTCRTSKVCSCGSVGVLMRQPMPFEFRSRIFRMECIAASCVFDRGKSRKIKFTIQWTPFQEVMPNTWLIRSRVILGHCSRIQLSGVSLLCIYSIGCTASNTGICKPTVGLVKWWMSLLLEKLCQVVVGELKPPLSQATGVFAVTKNFLSKSDILICHPNQCTANDKSYNQFAPRQSHSANSVKWHLSVHIPVTALKWVICLVLIKVWMADCACGWKLIGHSSLSMSVNSCCSSTFTVQFQSRLQTFLETSSRTFGWTVHICSLHWLPFSYYLLIRINGWECKSNGEADAAIVSNCKCKFVVAAKLAFIFLLPLFDGLAADYLVPRNLDIQPHTSQYVRLVLLSPGHLSGISNCRADAVTLSNLPYKLVTAELAYIFLALFAELAMHRQSHAPALAMFLWLALTTVIKDSVLTMESTTEYMIQSMCTMVLEMTTIAGTPMLVQLMCGRLAKSDVSILNSVQVVLQRFLHQWKHRRAKLELLLFGVAVTCNILRHVMVNISTGQYLKLLDWQVNSVGNSNSDYGRIQKTWQIQETIPYDSLQLHLCFFWEQDLQFDLHVFIRIYVWGFNSKGFTTSYLRPVVVGNMHFLLVCGIGLMLLYAAPSGVRQIILKAMQGTDMQIHVMKGALQPYSKEDVLQHWQFLVELQDEGLLTAIMAGTQLILWDPGGDQFFLEGFSNVSTVSNVVTHLTWKPLGLSPAHKFFNCCLTELGVHQHHRNVVGMFLWHTSLELRSDLVLAMGLIVEHIVAVFSSSLTCSVFIEVIASVLQDFNISDSEMQQLLYYSETMALKFLILDRPHQKFQQAKHVEWSDTPYPVPSSIFIKLQLIPVKAPDFQHAIGRMTGGTLLSPLQPQAQVTDTGPLVFTFYNLKIDDP